MTALTLALLEQIACGAPAKAKTTPARREKQLLCVNDVVKACGFEITISQPRKMALLKALNITPVRVSGNQRVRMLFEPNAVTLAVKHWQASQKQKASEARSRARSHSS